MGMKALQLHQVMSAMTAIEAAARCVPRFSGREHLGDARAARQPRRLLQRSGSWMNMRTTNATAAGSRPHRNTYRHDVSGAL